VTVTFDLRRVHFRGFVTAHLSLRRKVAFLVFLLFLCNPLFLFGVGEVNSYELFIRQYVTVNNIDAGIVDESGSVRRQIAVLLVEPE